MEINVLLRNQQARLKWWQFIK